MKREAKMNPWIITWETHQDRMRSPIAAILHNATSAGSVGNVMHILYCDYISNGMGRPYPSEQIRYAQRKRGAKVREANFSRLFLEEGVAIMFARKVWDLKLTTKSNGHEVLTWEEGVYPDIRAGDTTIAKAFNRKERRPRKRRSMTFDSETKRIVMGGEIVDSD